MFITLTNASPAYKGLALSIKKDIIVSVFEDTIESEDGTKTTRVFSTNGNTWEVEESFQDVIKLLNKK